MAYKPYNDDLSLDMDKILTPINNEKDNMGFFGGLWSSLKGLFGKKEEEPKVDTILRPDPEPTINIAAPEPVDSWQQLYNGITEPIEKEQQPLVWKAKKDPLVKRIWDYLNPLDLFKYDKPYYEPTDEMKQMGNMELFTGLKDTIISDTNKFMKYEQELRNRKISPLQYMETAAGVAVLSIMGIYGVQGLMTVLGSNPTLRKGAVKFLTALNKIGGIKGTEMARGGLVPMYAGYPLDKLIASPISGIETVGELQLALSKLIPQYPAVIDKLIDTAVGGMISSHDILSATQDIPEAEVKQKFGAVDKLKRLFGIKVEEVSPEDKLVEEAMAKPLAEKSLQEETFEAAEAIEVKPIKPEIEPKKSMEIALTLRGTRGDSLLDSLDLADELVDKNAEISTDGIVTLYHRTSKENADKIIRTGKMVGKEDRLFFGTQPTGQIEGYGDAVVRVKIPLEKLELSDVFTDEAHVTMKSGRIGTLTSVKVAKPEIAPKGDRAQQFEAIEKEILAEHPELKAGMPTIPPAEPPSIPPRVPPSDVPGIPDEPEGIDPIDKLNELIKAAKPKRGEIERAYTEERGKRIAEVDKFIRDKIDTVGGEEGYKAVIGKLKGELISPEAKPRFEAVKDKLTEEEIKSLFLKTWKHPYLTTWEKVTATTGLTDLFMGNIPPPSTLVLMEEVYGSELIKNILSKRLWGAKITDFALEVANIPRALLATADMSAFLRQGIIEIAAHPVISSKAMAKTFQLAFQPKVFEKYFSEDLRQHRHYDLMRKSKVAITDPKKPPGEREEPFISRLLQNIPILNIPVKFAERAYTGFLTKLRVDIFSLWADELLAQGLSPVKDKRIFDAAADVVNTFTGRGSLGRAGNRITRELNVVFFSPRLIAARFKALNPVWYATQPKEIRKKAIGDFAKFVIVGTTTLALIKLAAMDNDDIEVETNPISADFGKIRIGNTRFDIWGGHQQFVRVFAQIIMGERKSSTTGEIMSLNKDQYPFTTRLDILESFIYGKLAPTTALIKELMAGAKTFEGEDITVESVAWDKLIPMYIQDIADAYRDGGLEIAIPAGIGAFFGLGVQTYGKKKPKKTNGIDWQKIVDNMFKD